MVFENTALRRIFGPKKDEVTEKRKKLHNEELHDLYSSPNILRVIKSRRMRWAGHVAWMGRREACIGFWWENPRERGNWGDPSVDRRIILGWLFRKLDVGVWIGLGWLRMETMWRAIVNAVMNLRVQQIAGNSLTSYKPVSFSRRTLLHGVSKYEIDNSTNGANYCIIIATLKSLTLFTARCKTAITIKKNYCCFSIPTIVTGKRHIFKCYVGFVLCKR
jgi:hypothetical protein